MNADTESATGAQRAPHARRRTPSADAAAAAEGAR